MSTAATGWVSSQLSMVLGVAWGLVLSWPLAVRARRHEVRARTAPLGQIRARRPSRAASLRHAPVLRVVAELARRRQARTVARRLASELPVVTDLLGVAVGAGTNPTMAVELAARWAPDLPARAFRRVHAARDRGATFAEALTLLTDDSPGWMPIVDALLATERLGAPIGASLARVAEAQRSELRRAAEAHARRVPVRLLFPLVFLVLPAFGLLTVVPVLVSGLTSL